MIRVDNNGSSSALIQVRGVNKTYRRGGENIQVLQGLNLDVDKGDFVAFMGPSGSGKTTLLNLLGGLDVPSSGHISVDGDEITNMSASKLTQWRARHVGLCRLGYPNGAGVRAGGGTHDTGWRAGIAGRYSKSRTRA